MDDVEFKFLRDWADDVAWDIIYSSENTLDCYAIFRQKITSIILESMSPAKVWKNGINKS